MPNARILEKKKAIVADLTKRMQDAPSGVLVDYKGVTVDADTRLRQDLRKAGVSYEVVKNTLMRLAVKECGLDGLIPHLEGTTALAVASSDMVAPAKILNEFAKKSNGKFKIKAGFVEGGVISAADVGNLADLPPREQLIARALAGFNSPISGFANVLNANLRGLVVALNAIAEQKGA